MMLSYQGVAPMILFIITHQKLLAWRYLDISSDLLLSSSSGRE